MKKIFIAIPLIFLTACTVFESDHDNYWLNNVRSYKTLPINYYDPHELANNEKLTKTTTLNTRIYQRNTLVSANLGQRMIDAQTYTVKNYAKDKIVAAQDGELYTLENIVAIRKGDVYTPLGEVKINGSYFLLVAPNQDGSILLIDENGKFLNMICRIYRGELLIPRDKALIKPEGLGVIQDKDIRETKDEPKLQFEIKYDGMEDDMMAFIYTDYSNSTSSRGYFQRFVFPKEQNLININGVKFKIMDAYPDRVEYMILD